MVNRRFLTILAGLAVVISLTALWVEVERRADTIRAVNAAPAFPDFAARAAEVTRIEVRRGADHPDGTLTLTRTEDGWTIAEKDHYPARKGAIRAMLVGLSDLTLVEAKTRDPARYAKLDLSPIEEAGGRATRLILRDGGRDGGQNGGGAVLIDALFGKQVPSLSGGTPSIYMRRTGEEQSWLASGEMEMRGGPLDWLAISLAALKRGRVAEVALKRPDQDSLRLTYTDNRTRFTLRDVPEGRDVTSVYPLQQIGTLPERLIFTDVRRAAGLQAAASLGTALWRTGDGLTLTLSYARDPEAAPDAALWVLVQAKAGAGAAASVVAEAAAITGRTAGWAFRLAAPTMKQLAATMTSLTGPRK